MKFFSKTLEKIIKDAPMLPGCYLFKDGAGKILYIGKAIQLHDRVKSYFAPRNDLSVRIMKMVEKIRNVEFITVDSEVEALVLETNLIHKYHPKYNVDKKDDKNYQWLKFLKNEDFPRPLLVRAKISDNARYFGPYPSGLPLKRTLKYLRKVFPFRTCNRKIEQLKSARKFGRLQAPFYSEETGRESVQESRQVVPVKSSDPKPCLFYFLGLCPAPCAGKISKKEYSKNISHIKEYFTGKKENLIYKLKEEMAILSKDRKYEEAALMRDKINDFIYIAQKIEVENNLTEEQFVIRRNLSKLGALKDLLTATVGESFTLVPDFKIECYDISNIQGKLAVGSMVVFINGVPAKKMYRKFRIKLKDQPDDYAMLQEVFTRRFSQKNLTGKDASFSILPDLIIVDGGKGQLSSSFKILQNLKILVPIIGLAKKYDDVFTLTPSQNTKGNRDEFGFGKVILKQGSESKFLIQRIRDEAHRFGIAYHRNIRLKAQKFSILSTVPGVGKVIGLKLLRAFGSIEKIKSASAAELNLIVKNKKTVAGIMKM
jgi:excinuclease ABC subunit C